mmetsp:Transcript_14085/g.19599  ORF Transcript_14085/g.19599 Transcript_14085/m.19599 type:complete len:292 (+) Transcript_14085:80-955(+)
MAARLHTPEEVEKLVAQFHKNTKTTKISENEWKIKLVSYSVSPISVIQNGGYVFACFIDVFDQIFGSEFRLLAATINYFAPCGEDEVVIHVEHLKHTNKYKNALAHLKINNQLHATILVTYCHVNIKQTEEIKEIAKDFPLGITPPNIPLNECEFPWQWPGEQPQITKSIARAWSKKTLEPKRTNYKVRHAETAGWYMLPDNYQADSKMVAFLSDATPPSIFNWTPVFGWAPTISLTLYFLQPPAAGSIKKLFRLEHYINIFQVTDGYLWDSKDNLVAVCRQVANFLPAKM